MTAMPKDYRMTLVIFATGGASLLGEGVLERGASPDDSCEAARTWHLA
ncbi:MAG: hypothetical protein P8L79_05425 [Rhodospirillaceae bacterium]|jgi:hypothetical protein|nr:hypothetical protein [Rhodospirillaceae bacterium]